ncbi:MAG: recombination-associated protein RdgC, partial [Cellvibrionaceae bacterium]|nr:recombination-associated protein RdgC [Cellvibrionaceae bacterium]
MWFKNIRIYQLSQAFEFTPESLNEALEPFSFQPCGKIDPVRHGWVPPLGRHGSELVHATNGYLMICLKRQEKILPATVVKEHLEEKVLEISTAEGRRVSGKERETLKEEIIFSLLPKAFTKDSLDFAYIDTRKNRIVTNCSSANHAEQITSSLREALGSLPAVPLQPQQVAPQLLTLWLTEGKASGRFTLGEECELQSPKDGQVIRGKNVDIASEEVINHIHSGMIAMKVALNWNEAIDFILDDQFAIKRLKFADEIIGQANDIQSETAAEDFDADFSIMTTELSAFIDELIKAFGGLAPATNN